MAVRVLIGVTGASGAIFAKNLFFHLLKYNVDRIYLVATHFGKKVCFHELGSRDEFSQVLEKRFLENSPNVKIFENENMFAPVASGSSVPTHMVVLPCSMGALSRIAHGNSHNLLERSADVVLKEQKKLILCPRETPLSTIHLENMLKLSRMHAQFIPCMPGFYHKPKTIEDLADFMSARILDSIGIENDIGKRWNSNLS